MSKVGVIGGGAAGMMAAISAAMNGHEVTILEKNEKLGKKIFITGKGRCNFTNASSVEEHIRNCITNPKFMISSLNRFTPDDVIVLIEGAGVRTKVERGNRAFPSSDHSSDIIKALKYYLDMYNVSIMFNCEVNDIKKDDSKFVVNTKNKNNYSFDSLVVATGGLSYQSTGSTGDGYVFAKALGHTILKQYPSLVPLNCSDEYIKELQGLSLKNVSLSLKQNDKVIYSDNGEMMFTHFGVTGPLILSSSALLAGKDISNVTGHIDLKPALDYTKLDKRILRDFDEFKNKNFANALGKLLPKKLIPVIINKCGIDQYKKVNEITREERSNLVKTIKDLSFTISGLRGYNEAVVTKGGVNVKEINPKTMESKLVPNLYFVGEVLDLDSFTGGFNLQIAWSTGYAAGESISYV